MHRPMNILVSLLAISTLSFNRVTCLGDDELCSDDVCELVTGCYSDKNAWYDSCNMNWWAYVPRGKFACPEGGCPLYIWMHGTKDVREQESFIMLFEMMKRGFIAVQAGYDAGSTIEYINLGCEGKHIQGLQDKAEAIFDSTDRNSVVSQLCDGADSLANCDLGIAVHGFSQGAQLASLAGNYSPQVSAALMFGNGNYNPMLRGDFTCLNDNNLVLTRERRRSITGSNDGVFGDGTLAGTMKQQKETSGYDCGDRLNCFSHVPNEVSDTYLGGDAMIENTGGYYLISGEDYDAVLEIIKAETGKEYLESSTHWDSYLPQSAKGFLPLTGEGVGHWFFHQFVYEYNVQDGFLGQDDVWGIPESLDWLDRTARKTAAQPVQSLEEPHTVSPTYYPTKASSDDERDNFDWVMFSFMSMSNVEDIFESTSSIGEV